MLRVGTHLHNLVSHAISPMPHAYTQKYICELDAHNVLRFTPWAFEADAHNLYAYVWLSRLLLRIMAGSRLFCCESCKQRRPFVKLIELYECMGFGMGKSKTLSSHRVTHEGAWGIARDSV